MSRLLTVPVAAAETDPTVGLEDGEGLGVSFPAYQTQDDVMFWLKEYYSHPSPALALFALEVLAGHGVFSPVANSSLPQQTTYFFYGVLLALLQRHADQLAGRGSNEDWLPRLGVAFGLEAGTTPDRAALVLATSLWQSGNRQARDYVTAIHSQAEATGDLETSSQLRLVMSVSETDVLDTSDVSLANVGVRCGMLRAKFAVTGGSEALETLAELAQRFHTQTLVDHDEAAFAIGMEARQTLMEMALENDSVLQFCETRSADPTAPDPVREVLQTLTTKVREKRN